MGNEVGRKAREMKGFRATGDQLLFSLMLEGSGAAAEIPQKLGIRIEQLRQETLKSGGSAMRWCRAALTEQGEGPNFQSCLRDVP